MDTPVTHPQTVLIPGGAFTMGDDNQRPDERPAHRVTVSAFRMAVLPVTNEDYDLFLITTGHEPPRFWEDPAFSHPRQPVVGASWFEVVAYCDWLSGVVGGRFRLPTEAEWEKAALGGLPSGKAGVGGSKYPWGDEPFEAPDGSRDGRFKQDATWEVGTSPANGYGLVDIGFNVHEWCSDWYDSGYYFVSPDCDPQGPLSGERRASRGGAWRHAVKVSRCSARSSIPPEYRYNDYGFRMVQEVGSGGVGSS